MKIEIRNHFDATKIIYEAEADSLAAAVVAAVASGADLSRADLSGANLSPIRDDIYAILCSAPREVPALREALAAGRVNGSWYRDNSDCGCLVGTLAIARGCREYDIPGLKPNQSRPAERFFMAINPGDKPETSEPCRLALGWVDEWLERMREAFGSSVSATAVSPGDSR